MINNKIYQLYKKLMLTFGEDNQIIVAIEELAELQKELTKWIRGKGHICNIAEEIADVLHIGFKDWLDGLHLDITRQGIIRIWSNKYKLEPQKQFRCSDSVFMVVEKEE